MWGCGEWDGEVAIVFMLTPPTDRLHKFQAVAGVALVVFGLSIPMQRYEEAEVQRIEAWARAREMQFAYGHYATQVNSMVSIYNDAISRGLDKEELTKIRQKILAMNPEANSFGQEAERAIVESLKQSELAMHMESMRNLWFAIGAICVLGGAILGFFGFRQWLLQPRNER